MLIRFSKEEVTSLLNRAQSVLERKSTRPILEHLLLEAREETLQVSATDLRVSLVQTAACVVEQPGSVSIPGRKLHEIVREMPRGEVTLQSKENNWVTVTAENSVFHLPGVPADEYPGLPNPPTQFLELAALNFRQMLDKTLFAASNDESRMYLCGVFTSSGTNEAGQPYLRMVATDGHRLCLADRTVDSAVQTFGGGVIIPKKGLAELKALLDGQEDSFQLSSHEGRIFVRVGSADLAITLIDGSFPNYQQVIPQDNPNHVELPRLALMDALRRVSLLSDEETHSILLETAADSLTLSSTNPQFGDAREELPAESTGNPLRIAFNAAYFMDALKAIHGETVRVAVRDTLAPCVLTSATDPGYLCVVMPMRID